MQVSVHIDTKSCLGPLETWRHTVGQGGINPFPLPERVIEGAVRLRPRLIRVFIQEFFAIYPAPGRFDWHRLDPYMDALARTGARVVAAITIKPKVLYPEIDHARWRPRDIGEWQHVISQLVRRYSVERPIVTHWEIGNEPDIGEDGGSPYLIRDPEAYGEYYTMTIRPILETFPQAKVGGPASAAMHAQPLPGLIEYCRRTETRLDFLSWHLYHNDPSLHAHQVRAARLLVAALPTQPELMVTEWSTYPAAWNRGSSSISNEEQAFDARRAAMVAATIIDMRGAGLDYSFYYHLWDQVCYPADFAAFFSVRGVANMAHHWNEAPHRLGLFGVDGQVRQMLSRLGDEEVMAFSEHRDVRVLAGRAAGHISALIVNHGIDEQRDHIAALRFANLLPGVKQLTVYRVDRDRRWSTETLELEPVERRETYAHGELSCQVGLPANSVALVCLSDPEGKRV
jgi:xylan 1,4-beta-xylosidase